MPRRMAILSRKKNLRLLLTGGRAGPGGGRAPRSSTVAGGFLAQGRDAGRITQAESLKTW